MKTKILSGALARIVYQASSSPSAEIAGLLIGNYDEKELRIEDAATGEQSGNAVSVNLTADVQAAVAERLANEGSKQCIVGWYHSHPNLGVFLSGTDVATQSMYRSLDPHCVALVIDPASYLGTRKVEDVDFKIFQVRERRKYEALPVTIEKTSVKDLQKIFQPFQWHEKQKTGMIRIRLEKALRALNKASIEDKASFEQFYGKEH